MPTISAVVLPHQQKQDGTWNVKIRIGHQSKSRYIDTKFYVSKDQLDKKKPGRIKDLYIIDRVAPILKTYRDKIADTPGIDDYSIDQVRDLLVDSDKPPGIDFVKFSESFIEAKIKAGRAGSAKTLITVVNSLKDYFGGPVMISEITSNFLVKYEAYLRAPRTLTRQGNKTTVQVQAKGLSDAGLHNHMRDLRLLFNAARDHYNDEDLGLIRIPHYPFKKYKLVAPPETKKRNREIDEIIKIRDFVAEPGSRAELARDLFMLSFYLCGMNAKDIYNYKGKGERIEYERAKTSSKRRDRAFISINLIPEAAELINKHKLTKRYSSVSGLNTAIDKGLQVISDELGIDIDFYDARHSFATLARNVCRFSKDDVAMALNHVDQSNRVTDIYIAKDWSIVDEVQAGVVGLLKQQSPNEGA